MSHKTAQRLIASASALLGPDELAARMGIESKVLAAWISGDATVPGVQLKALIKALEEFAARK
ncbi:MAG TPA: hypothetical protein VNZ59_02865 [Burkholderiales bacterium]|nr:hypothetical protein [Burkholderiales bacterium]